jgi:hypothetical protein
MGRSTINSGAFNFKKKWGGEVKPLYWQYYLGRGAHVPDITPHNPRFSLAINCWKRLPVSLTNTLGPLIAKYIP